MIGAVDIYPKLGIFPPATPSPRDGLTWRLMLSPSEAILLPQDYSSADGARSRAVCTPGDSHFAGPGRAAAGTDLLFICQQRTAALASAGGRERGWHTNSSLSRQSMEQVSLLDFPWQLCSLRVCATSSGPAEPHELTWARTQWCSQCTKRFLAWAVQPQQRSWSLPLLPAHSREHGWKTNGWSG